MARTMKEKALYIEEQKQKMYSQLLLKGYSPAEITDLLANYPKLIAGLDCNPLPKWFRDALVCWYNPKKQGLKNTDIVQGTPFALKDFSGNGLDMTMYNFAGEGMSGMDGYAFDFEKNWGTWINSNTFTTNKLQINEIKSSTVSAYSKQMYTKMKLNCTGLDANKGKVEWIKVYGDKDIDKAIYLKDGVQEITVNAPNSSLVYIYAFGKSALLENPIIIEVLPEYDGALVFDGVDDYGICENQPILTDSTVMVKRKVIKFGHITGVATKRTDINIIDGAFCFEREGNSWSFGQTNAIKNEENLISYQTSESYNGVSIKKGKSKDTSVLCLATSSKKTEYFTSMVLYEFLLFNRTLTPDEIDWVKYNIMGEELPKPIAKWDAEGRRNDEPEAIRNILLDKSGNGHNITLNNFAFSGMSGYGGFKIESFDKWSKHTGGVVFSVNYNTLNITKGSTDNPTIIKYIKPNEEVKFNVYAEGITQDTPVFFGDAQHVFLQNGINRISMKNDSAINEYWSFRVNFVINCNILIKLLPEYDNALVFDGVDDYGICENMPIFTKEKGYTLIAERVWFDGNEQYDCFLAKRQSNQSSGAFIFERSGIPPKVDTYNFGTRFATTNFLPKEISFQTSKSYNGKAMASGDAVDGSKIILGANDEKSGYWKGIVKQIHIFDHDLTNSAIEAYIRRNINPSYTLPQD